MANDERSLKAAAFLIQTLDLAEAPAALAPELVELKRDVNAGIYSVQLQSSVGPAAFLVYLYDLALPDEHGHTGRQLFDADLATLETAAERDTPGPRIVAHALTDDQGFILATTPATYRALAGEPATEGTEASPADLLPTAETAETRRAAADELLRLLRAADTQAATWLAALRAEGQLQPAAGETTADDTLRFNEEENGLALFLLDERSIHNLLSVLNLVLSAARHQAADVLGPEPAG